MMQLRELERLACNHQKEIVYDNRCAFNRYCGAYVVCISCGTFAEILLMSKWFKEQHKEVKGALK